MTPRLQPERPLPPYTHVPGRTPHPVSDPRGHSHGHAEPALTPFDPDACQADPVYRFAFDLFNHGYYWEAHEQWERLWHACGRRGAAADFMKALIKMAAAGVKHLEGRPEGVRTHTARAAELWRGVGRETWLGFAVADLVALAERVGREGWPAEPLTMLPVHRAASG